MKLSYIIWVIVAVIIIAILGWWAWGYFYPTGTPNYQATENEGQTQNQESEINDNQDLTTAEQSLEASSFTEIDAGLNQNTTDQNSF